MTRFNRRTTLLLSAILVVGPLLADVAVAQPVAVPRSVAELQPIIVTATKRRTNIQTTPISITAITAAEIASRGISSLDALAGSVPGLSARTSGPGQTEFEMRGLNSQGGNSSMVGLYFGDVPLSAPADDQLGKVVIDPSLYDLNRVEVLRGPQGTLYGSSSMGGTIRLVPNAPRLNRFEASGEEKVSDTIDGGGLNHQENGMLNIPFGRNLAVRLVGSTAQDSGWLKRLVFQDGAVAVDSGVFPAVSRPANFYTAPLQETQTGVNSGSVDSYRVEVLWKPLENLSITPMVMYQKTRQNAPTEVDVNGVPTHPKTPVVKGHYEIYDTPEPQRDSFSLGSLKVEYRLPTFTLTSATGFWHRNSLVSQDATEEIASAIGIPVYDAAAGGTGAYTPTPIGPGTVEHDYSRQLTEEFRAVSTGPGPFQWVMGYFYQDLHSEFDVLSSGPQAAAVLGGTNVFFGFQPEVLMQNAVFGHFSWRFSPHFEVAAGFRRYHYSLSEQATQYGVFSVNGAQGDTVPFNSSGSDQASGTIPSLTLTYNVDSNHMVYVNIAKGLRLGGVSQPVPVALSTSSNSVLASNECALQAKILLSSSCNPNVLLQAPRSFGSDWVWSWELGEKSSFFNHRLIANVDGYYESWRNPQVATDLAGFGVTVNGGEAEIKGVEGQLEALLGRDWDISGNGDYTDAKFVQGSAITGFPEGAQIPDTPELQASAVLSWHHHVTDSMSLVGSIEEDYTGSRTDAQYGETLTLLNYNQLIVHLPSYSLVNASFGVRSTAESGARWTASLFIDNLTNNQVLLDPQPQIALQTAAFSRYAITRPLTAGLDVTFEY